MKVSLTQKIFAGNFLLLAAIVGMVVILFRERSRMREIDAEVHDLQSVRNDIHAAQLYIPSFPCWAKGKRTCSVSWKPSGCRMRQTAFWSTTCPK